MIKRNRTLTLFLVYLAMATGMLPAERIGILTGVFKPGMMKVCGDELLVVEGHRILIYSLDELRLKRVIGKQGEGPGETRLDPSRTLIIAVTPHHILAESRYKMVVFSRQGSFIRELRKQNFSTLQILPVGKNYLVYHYQSVEPDRNRTFFMLTITDHNFKPIRELHRQKFFSFEDQVHIVPDGINYRIHQDRIYVEKSNQGFVIDIYDFQGRPVKHIEENHPGFPLTRRDRDNAYRDYLQIPSLQRYRKEQGEAALKALLDRTRFVYPENWPPILDIQVESGKIYVFTPQRKEEQIRILILDLEGRHLGESWVSRPCKVDFLVQMQGDKKYCDIHKGRYYHMKLVPRENDEEWELHAQNIEIFPLPSQSLPGDR